MRLRRPTPTDRRRPWPAPTIRLRLTATYGIVFLLTGAVLLTIGYLIVRHNLDARPDFRQVLQRSGLRPPAATRFFGRPLRFAPGSPEANLAEAARAQLRTSTLHRLLLEYVIALVAMTVISVGAGWLLAGRALAPLRRIITTARRVSGENLGERIAMSGPADELKELADTFDGMLARLDRAFASQRHFVASASHELRTPLAIMRAEIDVALASGRASASEMRQTVTVVRESVERCERLIEGLLTLARSDSAAPSHEPVDLATIAADCITDLAGQVRRAGIEVETALEPAATGGSPPLVERMVANLVENAIRYNRPGGRLWLRTGQSGGRAALVVGNDGRVVDPEQVESLVEPFQRLERSGDGFGLGLSIVRSVVEAHGGELSLLARAQGGLEVTVRLPAAPVSAPVTALSGAR